MRRFILGSLVLALAATCGGYSAPAAEADDDPHSPPFVNPSKGAAKVEAVFVLDSTGSMSGLIEGAKSKIWAIAQAILSGDPRPEVRFGLISYRDKGDAYVTKVFDLSADLDEVYKNLRTFQADGGGDTPEHVSQALTEAVTKMSWSKDEKTLRLVFLVGDAPPHTDYKDGFDYKKAVKDALEKDIRVNTVLCGSDETARKYWTEIAESGKGEFAAIMQSGGMRVIETPVDGRIAELSRKMGGTSVAYGGAGARDRADAKDKLLADMPAAALAERAGYAREASKAAAPATAAGAFGFRAEWDLVAAVEAGSVKLADLKDEQLPEEMKKLSADERKALIDKKIAERKAIQEEIVKLSRERDEFIARKLKEEGKGERDAFDGKVLEMLKKQAESKGIKYKSE